MSTQTTNFGLNKDEGNNWYDVSKVNSNTDIIDTALGNTAKFEKAGGTATAITVTGVTIADGRSKTFIVKANNNGTATTINGKPLYKPETTSAPSLTTGKAVTVWYDLTGDCFFIKASAEGDAVAANVLAGKKFSNDNDTGITGTMANNGAVTLTPGTADQVITAGYHSGSGKVVGDTDLVSANIKAGVDIFGVAGKTSVVDTADANAVAGNMLSGKTGYVNGAKVTGTIASKAAATITPGTTDQTISAGQYLSGVQTIKGDANLVAAKIGKGTTIFNVQGELDARQLNFPLSIQDTTPTPVRAGHIWVKSSTLASQITKIKILEAVNAGEADGTLMFVVGDLALHSMSFTNTVDIDGGRLQVSVANTISSTIDWDIISKNGDIASSYKINRPMVYSKVGGLLDIENAYFWNGSIWAQISQKGTYAVFFSGDSSTNGLKFYNRLGDTLSLNSTVKGNSHSRFSYSRDGSYVMAGMIIYKRAGDVFAPYGDMLPYPLVYNSVSYYPQRGAMSGDGTKIVITYYDNSSRSLLILYKNNGTGFIQDAIVDQTTSNVKFHAVDINFSGTAIAMTRVSSSIYYSRIYYFNGSSWQAVDGGSYNTVNELAFSYDGNYVVHSEYTTQPLLYKMTLNYANKTVSSSFISSGASTTYISYISMHPLGYVLFLYNSTLQCRRISDGTLINLTGLSELSVQTGETRRMAFNIDGTRMLYCNNVSYYCYYSVSISGNNMAFSLIKAELTSTSNAAYSALIPA